MDNMTLLIDPDTLDLAFDENGDLKTIYGDDTTAQNVRHALSTWKKEFFADETHGTDYESIVARNQNEIELEEIKEVIREGIFQETNIAYIESLDVSYDGRVITATFTAVSNSGEEISMEVTA